MVATLIGTLLFITYVGFLLSFPCRGEPVSLVYLDVNYGGDGTDERYNITLQANSFITVDLLADIEYITSSSFNENSTDFLRLNGTEFFSVEYSLPFLNVTERLSEINNTMISIESNHSLGFTIMIIEEGVPCECSIGYEYYVRVISSVETTFTDTTVFEETVLCVD